MSVYDGQLFQVFTDFLGRFVANETVKIVNLESEILVSEVI